MPRHNPRPKARSTARVGFKRKKLGIVGNRALRAAIRKAKKSS